MHASDVVSASQSPSSHSAAPAAHVVRSSPRQLTMPDAVSAALRMMSTDLVKLICAHLGFPTAAPGLRHRLLLTFGSRGQDRDCTEGVACCPEHPDKGVVVCSKGHVQLFKNDVLVRTATNFNRAMGAAFDSEGSFYVGDHDSCFNRLIMMFHTDGFIKELDTHADAPFLAPFYIAVSAVNSNGGWPGHRWQAFVTCTEGVKVWQTDGYLNVPENCKLVRTFGSYGSAEGQLIDARGIAVNSATSEVAVADSGNHRIQVCALLFSLVPCLTCSFLQIFDTNGKFLRKFGSRGALEGQFDCRFNLAVDSAGNWLVCDRNNNRMQAFTADGSFITAFGDGLVAPQCICVDADGRILVDRAVI